MLPVVGLGISAVSYINTHSEVKSSDVPVHNLASNAYPAVLLVLCPDEIMGLKGTLGGHAKSLKP